MPAHGSPTKPQGFWDRLLDARRAPGYLLAIRKVQGVGLDHWSFQNHLAKPHVEHDRLTFTTTRPFKKEEARAWWLCYDSLRIADRELRDCDSLLRAEGLPAFQVRGVNACDHPDRLRDYVQVKGWTPLDTSIRITNVASLVKRLGGAELYGDDATVPLRELLQNAIDAVEARRLLDKSRETGEISVSLIEHCGKHMLTVTDSGIGMSAEVLTGPLLDFGMSYWGTDLMLREHPGLMADGFESAGRFGIGFFSVFMLGDVVQVISRSWNSRPTETMVLEFAGLDDRPLLRVASEEEQLASPGTSVSIVLRKEPEELGGLLYGPEYFSDPTESLQDLCARLCPMSSVTISTVEYNDAPSIAVIANDWLTIPAIDLFKRGILNKEQVDNEELGFTASLVQPLFDPDGTCIGRMALSIPNEAGGTAGYVLVCDRGICCNSLLGCVGVIRGRATNVCRDESEFLFPVDCISDWATKQAQLVAALPFEQAIATQLAASITTLGGRTGTLPLADSSDGWLTADDITRLYARSNSVLIADNPSFLYMRKNQGMVPIPDCMAVQFSVSTTGSSGFPFKSEFRSNGQNGWLISETSVGAILRALAAGWNCSVQQIIDASSFNKMKIKCGIQKDGSDWMCDAIAINRPNCPRCDGQTRAQ